eukprot:gb/GFBE01012724.1/.p1 GENE.gb/GFBE01012724.1/~~gb/GFBE01012724.1/.p1  ORF type:complete len:114 (+),score=22.57 gb/GFBE01012724.1/:1-342(+)
MCLQPAMRASGDIPAITPARAKAFLTEMGELTRPRGGDADAYRAERRRQRAQKARFEILHRYGFEASEVGAAQMWTALQPMLADPSFANLAERLGVFAETVNDPEPTRPFALP